MSCSPQLQATTRLVSSCRHQRPPLSPHVHDQRSTCLAHALPRHSRVLPRCTRVLPRCSRDAAEYSRDIPSPKKALPSRDHPEITPRSPRDRPRSPETTPRSAPTRHLLLPASRAPVALSQQRPARRPPACTPPPPLLVGGQSPPAAPSPGRRRRQLRRPLRLGPPAGRRTRLRPWGEMQQRCGRDAAEMRQRCGRDVTEMRQRCGRDAAPPTSGSSEEPCGGARAGPREIVRDRPRLGARRRRLVRRVRAARPRRPPLLLLGRHSRRARRGGHRVAGSSRTADRLLHTPTNDRSRDVQVLVALEQPINSFHVSPLRLAAASSFWF